MSKESHFERFQDHTRLKHFLLDAYLKQWATILVKGHARHDRALPSLWYIDAFAGAGRDETGAPGSPVIAAEIAVAINSAHYSTPLSARDGMSVVAVESDTRRFQRLKQHMEAYRDVADIHHGTLQPLLDDLLSRAGSNPQFYFLDPFGVGGLDAAVLPRILDGSRNEVLVLFSDEGAVRLAGKAGAVVPTKEELLEQRARGPSMLGEDFDAMIEEADRTAVDRVLAGHASNPQAELILDTAFGGHQWRDLVDSTPPSERQDALIRLYEDVLRGAGATHVLRFAVSTSEGRHKYTLLHASKHKRAFAAMKNAMHRTERQRERAANQAPTLFDAAPDKDLGPLVSSNTDVPAIVDLVEGHFAGQRVRFKGENYSDASIERFVIDDTPAMYSDLIAIRSELEHRGRTAYGADGKPERALVFEFPPK